MSDFMVLIVSAAFGVLTWLLLALSDWLMGEKQ